MIRRQTRLIWDTLVLGVVGALVAQSFIWLLSWTSSFFLGDISGYAPPGLPAEGHRLVQTIGSRGLWLIPLSTTLGGLISGLLVFSLAPEAEGHGTDAVVKAFHRAGGLIRPQVTPVKMVASALTIGSGGAAGREGPTALFSAGIGSMYASLLHRSDDERRLLVLIGMASGLSAVFRSPIGTAIFAIEVLYSGMEYEGGALLYTMLASVVAYVTNATFVGWRPLFHVSYPTPPTNFLEYGWYAALGAGSGLIATLLPVVFYGTRDAFRRLPLPPHVKPAIGGLGVGLIALAAPEVLGGGYGWIQEAIDGNLALWLLLALVFAKLVAFALTVSSGGSGGIFAPTLYVGAMLGALFAQVFGRPPAPFAIVGMAAVFAGAARVPIATMLMVAEMTEGYQLLVPAALAVMLSAIVQNRLSAGLRYQSLYEAQVHDSSYSPAHQAENLRTALALLGRRARSYAPTIGHLDLMALVESGIPIDLPGSLQLNLGFLKPGSSCVGKTLESGCLPDENNDIEVIAVTRDGNMVLPHPDLVLHENDELLLIATPKARDRLSQHITTGKSKEK